MAVGVHAGPAGATHTDSESENATRSQSRLAAYSRYLGHVLLVMLLVVVARTVRVREPDAPTLGFEGMYTEGALPAPESETVTGPEPSAHYLEQGVVPLTVRFRESQTSPIIEPRRQLRTSVITYTVQAGDTVLGIAQRFGLEGSTLLWANQKLEDNPDFLQVGQELNILPVDGAYHTVTKNQTVASIAKMYKVDVSAITGYAGNQLSPPYDLTVGQKLIIPGGTKPYVPRQVFVSTGQAPKDAKTGTGLFAWPISGTISQTYWAGHRAIDVAAPKGTPVYAADAGYVAAAQWSDVGYGRMVIIDHGNGYRTLYAHLDTYFVEVGESVAKGQQIGKSGSTGNSTGPHLHFEIMQGGTRLNPFNYLP